MDGARPVCAHNVHNVSLDQAEQTEEKRHRERFSTVCMIDLFLLAISFQRNEATCLVQSPSPSPVCLRYFAYLLTSQWTHWHLRLYNGSRLEMNSRPILRCTSVHLYIS